MISGHRAVHRTQIRLDPPVKYPTPYGGRLEWTLPGQNKLTIHLKDKTKVRHKKRWSQVSGPPLIRPDFLSPAVLSYHELS